MHDFILHRRARLRRITLSVNSKGKVRVTAPKLVPKSVIEKFVRSKHDWIERVLQKIKAVQQLHFSGPKFSYHGNKARAKKIITERVKHFARLHGFSFKRISIKNTSSRWGSCSTKENLNFNYKLIFLSEALLDYVVVHELCHLRHHNHSAQFWKEVVLILPDYRIRERELKKYHL
ncbi:MAG TPA: SprT family zinc-dependent metalloprotease [Candidatus Magasanikbacteria bacterium]|nr:SprT family zinc-dependent metalloprotease [Candidatus Magasanikbacteria bacterium]